MSRQIPEVNAGSMADIAFLLLIFFLVTTTMDVDTGIIRILPPPVEDEEIDEANKRDVLQILVNKHDKLLINGEPGNMQNLRSRVREFMRVHVPDDPDFPKTNEVSIELLGKVRKSQGIVSLKNDRGTSYAMYIRVQDELAAAFRELRDELSMEKFGRNYDDLIVEEQKKAIAKAIPIRVSEAEPENVGGGK